MFKKIREKLQKILPPPASQKGQGVVEYGLILGFVAVIGVYLVSQSGIKDAVISNVDNAKAVATSMNYEYKKANNQILGGDEGGSGDSMQGGADEDDNP